MASPLYSYLLSMWVRRVATETTINNANTNGKITEEERDTILATPQNPA
jgi:hypothetical protein